MLATCNYVICFTTLYNILVTNMRFDWKLLIMFHKYRRNRSFYLFRWNFQWFITISTIVFSVRTIFFVVAFVSSFENYNTSCEPTFNIGKFTFSIVMPLKHNQFQLNVRFMIQVIKGDLNYFRSFDDEAWSCRFLVKSETIISLSICVLH